MRACFLVPDLSPSGGVNLVRDHARRLIAHHGWQAAVVPVADRPALADAARTTWDIAVATWWTTIPSLHELRAERRGVLAQGFDPLHYRASEVVDRLAATAAIAAPFDVIAVSGWVRDAIAAVRPGAHCRIVRAGIDKEIFGGPPRTAVDSPLRILVEGQPHLWFKGVADALEAVAGMARRPHVTVAAPDPADLAGLAADRVVGGLDAAGMAALYRETDVVLKLSRFEGLGLTPLEAFHAGVPCVVTPYGGHREYLQHGHNGLLVGFDDHEGTTRALDRLDRDRELLARLSEGALATASDWPDPRAATAAMAAALGELGAGGERSELLDVILRHAPTGRDELARLREVSRLLAERQERVIELAAELDRATSSRAYRAAIALRSLLPGRR